LLLGIVPALNRDLPSMQLALLALLLAVPPQVTFYCRLTMEDVPEEEEDNEYEIDLDGEFEGEVMELSEDDDDLDALSSFHPPSPDLDPSPVICHCTSGDHQSDLAPPPRHLAPSLMKALTSLMCPPSTSSHTTLAVPFTPACIPSHIPVHSASATPPISQQNS
ncbi:hypothetical protein C0995_009055, partial [Termitomyces sp. Mi166